MTCKTKKVGRPTKLTPEIRENFIKNLKAGEYIETACTLAGISKPTYYSWIKKADESSRSTKYSKFRDEVTKAKAFDEARNVALITKAAEKHWKAAAWMLERRFTEKWGKPKYRNGNSKVNNNSNHTDDNVTIHEVLNILDNSNKK